MTLLLALLACTPDDEVPAWALDPMYVEVDGTEIYGFQTWEFFGERWGKSHRQRHYVCSVVVEMVGEESAGDDCEACDTVYAVTPSLLETDCSEDHATNPAFVSLTRLGIGAVDAAMAADDPHPDDSRGTWADYDSGTFEAHGWAYAASLDQGGSGGAWGETPYTLWPAFAWDLDAL